MRDTKGRTCTRVQVLAAVELRQWRDLAAVDQLLREQAKGRVFHGYEEKSPGHPTWAPTFKLSKKPVRLWPWSASCVCLKCVGVRINWARQASNSTCRYNEIQ